MVEENQSPKQPTDTAVLGNAPHLSVKDRVRRKSDLGTDGTIIEIREETNTNATDRKREPRLLIKIKWDNGTTSYCGPEALINF